MILPPFVIDVRIREAGKRGFRIWLPLFLLWPILFVIVAFALLVSMVVDFALLVSGASYHHYTLLVFGTMQLLADTRGTNAHINDPDTLVDVVIY